MIRGTSGGNEREKARGTWDARWGSGLREGYEETRAGWWGVGLNEREGEDDNAYMTE